MKDRVNPLKRPTLQKKTTKTPAPKETAISASIKDYLNNRGYTIWRNNTMMGRLENGAFMVNGMPGSPDLIGFTPEGYFLGIEVKRPGKTLSFRQVMFARKVRETKYGIYIVARGIDDVMEKLEGYVRPPLPF